MANQSDLDRLYLAMDLVCRNIAPSQYRCGAIEALVQICYRDGGRQALEAAFQLVEMVRAEAAKGLRAAGKGVKA